MEIETGFPIPTMKPLDLPKAENKAEPKPTEAPIEAPVVEEKIDFSNVVIEPLFQDHSAQVQEALKVHS